MARQWQLCCARHCLALFSFSLLLSILWHPLYIHAAPSSLAKHAYSQEHSLFTTRPSNNLYRSGGSDLQRRDVVRDFPDDSDDDTSTSGPLAITLLQPAPIASTLCDSETSQSLGPGLNGTFASNSPDGVYPSQTRSCRWTIQAYPADSGHSPHVIAINFTTPIQLVCG
jgi:hypothetical protein